MNAMEFAWISKNMIYKPVTNPSPNPLKPTGIAGQYFLYREVNTIIISCFARAPTLKLWRKRPKLAKAGLLLLFEVYRAKGAAFSSLSFATNLLLNPGFTIYVVFAARL